MDDDRAVGHRKWERFRIAKMAMGEGEEIGLDDLEKGLCLGNFVELLFDIVDTTFEDELEVCSCFGEGCKERMVGVDGHLFGKSIAKCSATESLELAFGASDFGPVVGRRTEEKQMDRQDSSQCGENVYKKWRERGGNEDRDPIWKAVSRTEFSAVEGFEE
jgi:hypothetical protein